jgi:hypothetical protein
MKHSRVTKLERLVRSRPCAGCGQPFHPPGVDGADWERLSAAEQREFAALIEALSTPACARCGRSSFDLSRMTDEQLDRTLELLRKLLDRTWPDDAGSSHADFVERHSR